MHICSLISAFVNNFLESTISRLATGEISVFKLVSVAKQTGLDIPLSKIPKTDFLVLWPTYY